MKKSIVFKLFNIPIIGYEVTTEEKPEKNNDNNIIKNISNDNIALLNTKDDKISDKYVGKVREDLNKDKKDNIVNDIIIKCPSCGGKTYQKDLDICCTCNKPICPDCSTEDPVSHYKYCNDCWQKL